MTLRVCVLLWERSDVAEELHRYEDAVLPLLGDHGSRLVSRDVVIERGPGDPLEIQIIEIPDQAALDGYLTDPRRAALDSQRERAIAKTQLFKLRTDQPPAAGEPRERGVFGGPFESGPTISAE